MRQASRPLRLCALGALAVLILASGTACSLGGDDAQSGNGQEPSRSQPGPSSPSPNESSTTETEQTLEETTASFENAAGEPDISLRMEGAPGTRFSGLCSIGENRSVLSGEVPKRFVFQLSGERLECKVQKQDDRAGSLRVTLLNDGSTRSVQQTNAPKGTITVSFGS